MNTLPYFIIQSSMRTGSTMLETALNTHPNLHCWHEIFNGDIVDPVILHSSWPRHIETRLRWASSLATAPKWGFKAHLEHGMRYPEYLNLWNIIPKSTKCIWVTRTNKLEQYTSWLIAHERQEWQIYTEGMAELSRHLQTKVDVECFFRWAKQEEEKEKWVPQRFNEWLPITYTDLVDNYETVLRLVLDYLEVEYKWVQPLTKKQGGPLPQRISNYQEVCEGLRDTKYEYCLV